MLRIDEISALIKKQIENYSEDLKTEEVGTVISVGDGIALIYGLDNALYGELLVFGEDVYGMVLNLEVSSVGAIIFDNNNSVREGDQVKRTKRILEAPIGEGLIGRVINPLGQPLDGKGDIEVLGYSAIEKKAMGVMSREPVNEPLQTGIKVIDSLVPIGRGQRELIIGDRQTGKTSIAIDTIINQKDQDVICIYVAIGQKESTVSGIIDVLNRHNAMDYTIIITASASSRASLQYLAPYTGVTIAEDFMLKGKDVLIVYDDLSKHAVAYRELALLLRRPPGREAYPGDVFYLHSRLLERSAKLHSSLGGGSITALPIVETQAGDISAYIPTNIISITDGQIFLQSDLFYSGVRPSINAGLSVSRVGGSAQIPAIKKVSGTLRIDLAAYRELEAFAQFGSDLDAHTKSKLDRGERTVEVFKQGLHNPLPVEKQALILYALVNGFLDDVSVNEIRKFEEDLYIYVESNQLGQEIVEEIKETKDLPDSEKLNQLLKEFKAQF